MCGLAGWNTSKEYAAEHLTQEVVESLTRIGMLKNLHRGRDAAGWMALKPPTEEEGRKLEYWKSPGPATDTLLKEVGPFPAAHSHNVCLHTRAATVADPDKNTNNHPLWDDYVFAVHNGNVRNHHKYRHRFNLGQLPPVDSWVIPAMINKLDLDPTDLDIKTLSSWMSDVEGPIVSQVMWAMEPDYLFFWKGKDREVWLAKSEEALFWSSEPDGLVAMVNSLPQNERFSFGKLQDYQGLLFHLGKVITSFSYRPGLVRDEPTAMRMGRAVSYPLDKNDRKFHWTKEEAPWSVYDIPEDHANLARYDWTENKPTVFPAGFPPGAYDAQFIYNYAPGIAKGNRSHVDARWYVLYDDVEMVYNGNGALREVYNWAGIETKDRHSSVFWVPIVPLEEDETRDDGSDKKPRTRIEKKLSLKQVRKQATARIAARQKAADEKKEKEKKEQAKKSQSLPIGSHRPSPSMSIKEDTVKATLSIMISEHDRPEFFLDETKLFIPRHGFWFVYKHNKFCNQHNVFMTSHEEPQNCTQCIVAAADTILALQDLDDFELLFGDEAIKLSDNEPKNHEHSWAVSRISVLQIGDDPKAIYKIPREEACEREGCKVTRVLDFGYTEEPFATLFDHADRHILEVNTDALSS